MSMQPAAILLLTLMTYSHPIPIASSLTVSDVTSLHPGPFLDAYYYYS